MEASSFVKFWESTRNPRRHGKPSLSVSSSSSSSSSSSMLRNLLDSEKEDLGEGDDSFFELEIPALCTKDNSHGGKTGATPISVSPADQFPKNKVIPVMVESRPQSPVGPLKTSSKFRAFTFKMSKSTEKPIHCQSTLSFRKTASSLNLINTNDTLSGNSLSSSPSKRFFSLIRPLYPKGSKKQSNKEYITSVNLRGQKVTRKHLGKSRSSAMSPAVVESASPASRRDESLLIQNDGIQSAILHCKRSFHCSRESSRLSRSTSDSSSLEKLSSTSSEDSYEFFRIGSDSSTERSEDGEKILGS